MSERTPPTDIGSVPVDAKQALVNLMEAVELQNDTIRKLADSVRILNNRVENLERDRPTRPIA